VEKVVWMMLTYHLNGSVQLWLFSLTYSLYFKLQSFEGKDQTVY